jgi:hypothetical protein
MTICSFIENEGEASAPKRGNLREENQSWPADGRISVSCRVERGVREEQVPATVASESFQTQYAPETDATAIYRLTADAVPRIVGSAMTTAVINNLFQMRASADVVISPRGRSMSWKVAGKYNQSGKQRAPV